MKKTLNILTLVLFSLPIFSCDNGVSDIESLQPLQDSTTIMSSSSNVDRSISKTLASQIISSLDFNKNGSIDISEAPIRVEGLKDILLNYSETDKGFTPLKPLTVKKVLDTFLQTKGSTLVISNGKVSEKNKSKLVSNLTGFLLKDTSTSNGKLVSCYSSDMGYTTRKKFFTFSNLDSSLVSNKILGQFELESGKDSSYGYLAIHRDYLKVGENKSRFEFYDHSDFDTNLSKESTQKFTDPVISF